MKFVESLGAGVRLRPGAERPEPVLTGIQESRRNSHVASPLSLALEPRGGRWFRKLGRAYHACALSHIWAIYLKSVFQSLLNGREHELDDASDPGRARPSFAALSILLLLRYQTSHVSWIALHGT